MEAVRSLPEGSNWHSSLERVVASVVMITYSHPFAFDASSAGTSVATGFVVDADSGYIITNRHVVGAGPFNGYCMFKNKQTCKVWSIYRDDVHDFGFFQFDPTVIKNLSINALELCPGKARIGLEIRVVGNDAGEELSILPGVISRLDCNAPEYTGGYSDFNTNYIQAATSAGGGSSGSPVVDHEGSVVALNAGGFSGPEATSFFLPLERPLRALGLLRQGSAIPRGTIQTQWELVPLDDCLKRGLSCDRESEIRASFSQGTSMLVAKLVLPDGPASLKVEEGDLLLRVEGKLLTQFAPLDAILDDNVGKTISIIVQRAGRELELQLRVGNLHTITPNKLAIVAGANFHNLSYQRARFYNTSLKHAGVCICDDSGFFSVGDRNRERRIQKVDNVETPDLQSFLEVFKNIPNYATVSVNYKYMDERHTTHFGLVTVDRELYPDIKVLTRNDEKGRWDSTVTPFDTFSDASRVSPYAEPCKTISSDLTPKAKSTIHLRMPRIPCLIWINKKVNPREAADSDYSFVQVHFQAEHLAEGFPWLHAIGCGVVVDANKGLVLVSRMHVPHKFCSVWLRIDEKISVKAKISFLHPTNGYGILSYDTSCVDLQLKTPRFATHCIQKGSDTILFGRDSAFQPVIEKTVVTDVASMEIHPSPGEPRYRAMNMEVITLGVATSLDCDLGVLADRNGTVHGFWLKFLSKYDKETKRNLHHPRGIRTSMLLPVITEIQAGRQPKPRFLNIQLDTLSPDHYIARGVSQDWVTEAGQKDSEWPKLFMVQKVDPSHDAGLKEGDILLTLNGKRVTQAQDLDVVCNNESLDAVIVRDCQKHTIKVSTLPTEVAETSHLVRFCGAIFHSPHHALRQQSSVIPSQVYISSTVRGSPIQLYNIPTQSFVMQVKNKNTPTMIEFREAIRDIDEEEEFTMKVITLKGIPKVVTLKKCSNYFPSEELIKHNDNSLQRRGIDH